MNEIDNCNLAYKLAVVDIGVYPASITHKDGTVENRTDWQNGFNMCCTQIIENAAFIDSFLQTLPDKIIEYINAGIIHLIVRDKKCILWINCNDVFYQGSDFEELEFGDLLELEQAFIDSPKHGDVLWACRKNKRRPQKYYYEYLGDEAELFNACGPENKEDENA